MSARTGLRKAYKIAGGKVALAKEVGIRYQTMDRWYAGNKLPCTDYNGETMYAKQIEELTNGEVTIEELLGFIPHPQSKEWKGKWPKKK